MNNKINFIYEFKTPNGYLPIGFDYNQLGLILDEIKDADWNYGSITNYRFGYDTNFKQLELSASAFDFLNLNNIVKNKAIYELTEDDIVNSINVFVIDSMHNEPIINYVNSTNFTNILSNKSKDLLNRHSNFRILIIDNKEGAYEHGFDFFNNLKTLHHSLRLNTNYQLYYITN